MNSPTAKIILNAFTPPNAHNFQKFPGSFIRRPSGVGINAGNQRGLNPKNEVLLSRKEPLATQLRLDRSVGDESRTVPIPGGPKRPAYQKYCAGDFSPSVR